jgi:hypothetical protein
MTCTYTKLVINGERVPSTKGFKFTARTVLHGADTSAYALVSSGLDGICQPNFPYGATTFSLIFTKGISHSGKLNTIISYRMKKWWRHTETFPQNRPADIIA